MYVSKLMAVATVAMIVALPAAAHPGPERHPTVEELEDVVFKIRLAIDGVDRRLGERIGDLEARVSEPDQQAIADIVEREIEEAVGELAQSSSALKDWVDTVVKFGAGLIVVLAGGSVYLGFQVSALKKQLSDLSQPARKAQEEDADSTNGDEREDEEREDEEQSPRVVTHTVKGNNKSGIKELHNLATEASWSPRTVKEAISDIDQGIRYMARGPGGNEAEIEVVRPRQSEPYLRTKPDEYGGNNLGELPDPP